MKRKHTNWHPRITAIPIVCTEGLLEIGIHRGATNGDVFLQFVNEKLVPNLLPFNGSVGVIQLFFCFDVTFSAPVTHVADS